MGKHRRKKRRHLEERLPDVPSDFLVPPPNPPGFGIEGPGFGEETVLFTAQKLFDDPFYTVLPPPPFGPVDPCYPQWVKVMKKAEERYEACPEGEETYECTNAREAYFEAARQYAYALDRVYGLNRVQPEQMEGGDAQGPQNASGAPRSGKRKNRT
jgi:hypothetical protein